MNRAELVEAAARAMCATSVRWELNEPEPVGDCITREDARAIATAALDAILAGLSEPSEEMVQAGMAVCYDQAPETIGIFRAMLSTLKDTPNG